ncbi:MAG: hypothetical protein M0006_09060 [Magnetospirillum sp.]|nr:hypothetical protein [Magnetospirillum sp.]
MSDDTPVSSAPPASSPAPQAATASPEETKAPAVAPAADSAPGDTTSPASGQTFSLIATNGSTVPGDQYFNVFPPLMTVKPDQPQTAIALVSSATVTGGGESAQTTLTWTGGAGALALIALGPGQDPNKAPRTPVALGATATVSWDNNGFTISQTDTGSAGAVTVAFSGDIPAETQIGLVVGPGPIPVPAPPAKTTLTLVPDLSPKVAVTFGTAFRTGQPGVIDSSRQATVSFSRSTASITVGLENLIAQTT